MAPLALNTESIVLELAAAKDVFRAGRVARQLACQGCFDLLQQAALDASLWYLGQRLVEQGGGQLLLQARRGRNFTLSLRFRAAHVGLTELPLSPPLQQLERALAELPGCRWSPREGELAVRFIAAVSGESLKAAPDSESSEELTPDLLDWVAQQQQQQLELLARAVEQQSEIGRQQQRIEQLTSELEETNQGVVALYSELEQHAAQLQHLNETLEERVEQRTLEAEQRASQLRALAAELTQTEQRERRRLAQLLHDHLQQLLVAARMNLSGLRSHKDPEVQREMLELVDSLLDESIEASRNLTIELSPPILYDAGLSPALEWLARQEQKTHGLQVELDLDPQAEPPTEELKVLLFQIVRELLFNVVKHAKVDRARIVTRRQDSYLRVTVADNGAGFDPGTAQSHDGAETGFGLFSIEERLEFLGGKLEIDAAPGKGSRMTIVVPCQASDGPPAATDWPDSSTVHLPGTLAGKNSAQIRVLLVEDFESLRSGLAQLIHRQPELELVGEAVTGLAAVEMALQLRPDVILMDVSLPDLDGIEATRRIKHHLPAVRVIGLCMHAENRTGELFRDAGAASCLLKDVPPGQLLEAIRPSNRDVTCR